MAKRVLITAGGGLIGAALARRLLDAGIEVTTLDERSVPEGTRHIEGRCFDGEKVEAALEGVTDIVHLEWSGGVREATGEPLAKHERAVTASIQLLEEARLRGLRFLYSSTSPYNGDVPEPLSEDAPLNDRSIYAAQKRYVEAMVAAYALNHGVPAATLRIFNAYGPGGRPGAIINRVRQALREDTPVQVNGDGLQIRDYIHVDDVAAAFIAALGAETLDGAPINVGTGVGTSLLDLARQIAAIEGKEVRFEFHPAKGEEARYLIADTRRAKATLGWETTISLAEGLRATMA
jgi:UDP-glucose 4-epimerase